MLREPQLQTKRGSLSPYLVVHLAADVHCGLLPVSHLPLLGSYTLLVPSISASCRSVQVLLHYFVGTNHLWLLVEGLYLHALLEPTVLPERRLWPKYLVVGWAFPMLFVIPWIFVRASLENTGCWAVNENKKIWWIIRGPILLCVTVNFFIFLKILKLLISKFRAHQMCFRDYKYRLAKSTLLLILLMGVHEFLFTFFTDDQVQGFSRLIRLFIQLTLSSFHGFLVALQYGFASREVPTFASSPDYVDGYPTPSYCGQDLQKADLIMSQGQERMPGEGGAHTICILSLCCEPACTISTSHPLPSA
uniref:Glucagon-like peptide 2 receptor n=1 Tax=Mus musculus TaxID=10090 RepID=Q8BM22_MOUSE|nr:unnamed protein product [Mus musculus]